MGDDRSDADHYLDADRYVISANYFAYVDVGQRSAAGRLQEVQDLLTCGLIDRDEARELLDGSRWRRVSDPGADRCGRLGCGHARSQHGWRGEEGAGGCFWMPTSSADLRDTLDRRARAGIPLPSPEGGPACSCETFLPYMMGHGDIDRSMLLKMIARALHSAFPDRAEELMAALEKRMPSYSSVDLIDPNTLAVEKSITISHEDRILGDYKRTIAERLQEMVEMILPLLSKQRDHRWRLHRRREALRDVEVWTVRAVPGRVHSPSDIVGQLLRSLPKDQRFDE